MSTPIFNCVKLDTTEVLKALSSAGIVPVYDEVKASHITLEFKPASVHAMDGTDVTVHITSLRRGDGIEALCCTVTDVHRNDDTFVHCTLSHKEGVPPVSSKHLTKADTICTLDITVIGTVCSYYPKGDYLLPTTTAIFSSICRVQVPELLDIAKPGIVGIPSDMLLPRQVELTMDGRDMDDTIPAVLRQHRGTWIPTLSRTTAMQAVERGYGRYCTQSLLSYHREEYLSDPDVKADPDEHLRVSRSRAGLVVVAVIGDNRSCLSVCRNIVSGCQVAEKLQADAKGAMDASNIFLIEDNGGQI